MVSTEYGKMLSSPHRAPKIWSAALYIRLSKEDELAGESNSITSQREILREKIKQHPDIVEYGCYVDDGWTGTNFDRPGFTRMMRDIYDGKVNCVIVKDLSRFGRNYTKGGELITSEFVRLGVRFIAANNYYDSLSETAASATGCITLGITNVINESVSATTSANVRATLNINRRQGKFIGSFAAYGYRKDPEDHHHLIIDEEPARIVRLIFQKFLDGQSVIGIAKDLNALGVPSPTQYKKLMGYPYRHPCGKKQDGLWPDSSVRRILQNEMYTGTMVQGKNRIISYKDQIARACPKEEWFVVEGTHEAIIDRETFDKAQALFGHHIRCSPIRREADLFSGLVRCGDCGRIMNKKTNAHPYGVYHYYRCVTKRKMRADACTNHTIRLDRLEEAVLVFLRQVIACAVRMDELMKKVRASGRKKREETAIRQALENQRAEKEKCRRMMLDLYPDWKSGMITREEYLHLKADFQEKLTEIDQTISRLEKKAEADPQADGKNDFVESFLRYQNIPCLTRPMVLELVESIQVFEGDKIQINLKFQDAWEEAVRWLVSNRDAAGESA